LGCRTPGLLLELSQYSLTKGANDMENCQISFNKWGILLFQGLYKAVLRENHIECDRKVIATEVKLM